MNEGEGRAQNKALAEVFSMPRIVPKAEKKGLRGLRSYDIGNGWDFLKSEHRRQCLAEIRECKPRFVMVCPPCGPFSTWQRINRRHGRPTERELTEARVLLQFAVQVCETQIELGNKFGFEHPTEAESWKEQCMQRLSEYPEVQDVVLDQCMFGLQDPVSRKRYRKTTRLRTNCRHVVEHMACRCDGNHEHQTL